MQAKPIELRVQLPLALQAAREGMTRVLHAMAEGEGDTRTSLAVYLDDLHASIKGKLAVPIDVHVQDDATGWECAIDIHAASDEGFFPTFSGTLSLSPVGTHSELCLMGEYSPPLGAVGQLLDATVLRHAAHRSLESFLARVGSDIVNDTRATEEAYARRVRGALN